MKDKPQKKNALIKSDGFQFRSLSTYIVTKIVWPLWNKRDTVNIYGIDIYNNKLNGQAKTMTSTNPTSIDVNIFLSEAINHQSNV